MSNYSELLQHYSIHPTLMGLSGELLCPQSAQHPARVDGEGKNAHSPMIFWVALEVSSLV